MDPGHPDARPDGMRPLDDIELQGTAGHILTLESLVNDKDKEKDQEKEVAILNKIKNIQEGLGIKQRIAHEATSSGAQLGRLDLPPLPIATTEANIENALTKLNEQGDRIALNPNLYQDEEGEWHHKEDHGFDFLGKGIAGGFIPSFFEWNT